MWGIGIKDIIDVLLIATLLYYIFRLLRKSGVVNLFWGLLVVLFVSYLIVSIFQLQLTSSLLNVIIDVGVIAVIVIFQNEIRSFFYRVGSHVNFQYLRFHSSHNAQVERMIHQVVLACQHLSSTKTGALIVFPMREDLTEIAETGEKLDAIVSFRAIENIFFKNTPLHDGAVFIMNNRIFSAACILPVSQNRNLPLEYGLRHRAALGITERTDALAVVVSEETGHISFAKGNKIRVINNDDIESILLENYR